MDGFETSLKNEGSRFDNWLTGRFLERLQRHLDRYTETSPLATQTARRFYEITAYAMSGQGKRLRPWLTSLGYQFAGGPDDTVSLEYLADLQAAYETVHTYSLVHDDMPCMDDDDLRRGRPTVHKKFSEAEALLCGDVLLGMGFELCLEGSGSLAAPALKAQLALFHNACGYGGMAFGQWADMAGEQLGAQAGLEDLQFIHTHKTGALLTASFLSGLLLGLEFRRAVVAPAGGGQYRPFNPAGFEKRPALMKDISLHEDDHPSAAFWFEQMIDFGLLFQLTDDLLDLRSSAAEMGKTPLKDSAKVTYVSVLGEDGAAAEAEHLSEQLHRRLEDWAGRNDCAPGLADQFGALVDYVIHRKK